MRIMRNFSIKTVSLILAVCVLLSALTAGVTFTVTSQNDEVDSLQPQALEYWSGDIAANYASGSGTDSNPYIIETAEQLAKLVKEADTTGKFYKLACDIHINDTSKDNWKDTAKQWYGYNKAAEFPGTFAGTLDGAGHKIIGLYYNSNHYYVGLFVAMKNATVKNITLSQSYMATSNASGNISAFTGYVGGAINYSGCVLEETVTISGAEASGFGSWGSGNITVSNCASAAKIIGTVHAGAFFADVWSSTLKISNSFGTSAFSPRRAITSTNNYSTVGDSYGTNVVTVDKMKGELAKDNMPNLNWSTWKTTQSFPVVKILDPNGTKGEVWSGDIALQYAGGTGTQGDPYLIETPEQLARMVGYDVLTKYTANIQNNSVNKYYKLTADIYLNDVSKDNWYNLSGLNKWYSSNASRFCGYFDGNGYTIYGLYTDSSADYAGLIPVADAWSADRVFKDITISHSYISGKSYVGGIVGRIYSGNNKTVSFNNCYVTETVVFETKSASAYCGGIVGYEHPNSSSFFSFTGCAVLANVPTGNGFAGAEPASGTLSISNSFTVNNKWYPKSGALSDSYLVSDLASIFGAEAKDTMPGLAWSYIWAIKQDGYPVYYSRNYDLNGKIGEVWSGLTALEYAGGKGSENDPYKIATAEQFIKMLKDTANEGKYYELISDIRFNDTSLENWKENARKWSSITNRFKGNFDGNGHTISGIYYDGSENNVGLFCVAQNANIENLILNNSYIKSSGFAIGGVLGQAIGTVNLNECYVGEDVYIESTYNVGGDAGAGGIVGYGGATVKINGCAFLGTVKAPRFAGSIAGNCWSKVIITNTFSTADMRFCSKMALDSASDNNYSAYSTGENCVIYILADKMLGVNAMENMSGLDWGRIWKIDANSYPACQFAEDPGCAEGVWSGDIAESFAGGSGTMEDPYQISNGEQLALMVTGGDSAGKYYKLTADIRLNDTTDKTWRFFARQWIWTSNIFEGNFDGAGHKITGLYYNGTKSKVGLFSYTKNVNISNLIIDESYLHSSGYGVGSVIGDANAGTANITECYIGEKVDIKSTYNKGGDAGAGGIIGYGSAVITVKGCAFLGLVDAPNNAGAILGNCWAKDDLGKPANEVGNSFTTSSHKFCTKQYLKGISNNNYTASEKTEAGVVNIDISKMQGNGAAANMSKLDWGKYWRINSNGFPIPRFGDVVATTAGCWSGEIATEFAGGDGTKDNPYLIVNGEQLALMVIGDDTAGKYYKLIADIRLNDTSLANWKQTAKNWVWSNNIFEGNFNGDNHSITGFYFNTTMYKVGLFCYASNATVRNLIIDNSYIHSTNYATGTIIGDANGGLVVLSSCYVGEDVSVESTFNADQNVGAGGLIGYGSAEITIEGCAFLGSVKAPKNAGSFLGNCWGKNVEKTSGLTVKNSYTNSTLKFCSKQGLSGLSADNYSACSETEYGVYSIKAQQMKGAAAKQNMKALNWFRYWKTTSGYPMINGGYFNGVKGKVWSGKIAESFAGGSGTENDPYLIATGEQLAKILDKLSDTKGKYYKLTADIYLNDVSKTNWYENSDNRPWFWVSTARYGNFNGHFNGDGHVIHGLYLDLEQNASVVYAGLFPTVSDGTVVEKTGIANSYMKVYTDNIDWQSYVGGFTGLVFFNQADEDTDINNIARFSQCFGDSTVLLEGRYTAGIVAGGPRPVNIDNCYFIGKISGERIGAIIGNTWNTLEGGTVTKSYSATMEEDIFCGGRAGVQNSSTPFKYFDNYTNASGSVSGHAEQISLLMMRGDSAKKNMNALDFDKIWYAVPNGTPVLRIFGTSDKYSNTSDPKPIEISFASNGGTECETLYGNPEEKLELPTPTRKGYKFGGWYVYRELDIPFTFDYFPYFNQVLYAKWIPLGIIMDFEEYPNTMYDLGVDYEYFKPGAKRYDADYVKSGMAGMHRLGLEDKESDFLVNYEDRLTIGKKYNMSLWVNTDTDGTDVTLSLVHENWPDVYDTDSGVEKITALSDMKDGKWVEVQYSFIARSEWVAIRTSGGASVYFDDIMIVADSDKIYSVEGISDEDSANNALMWWIIGAAGAVILLAGSVTAVILVKKRSRKNK
ncbi:MAG: hypothetical protein E7562_04245 [Ruminococcaceae bacterium]|nr:hypothetical protein [Oscillospiraceae bacterium]